MARYEVLEKIGEGGMGTVYRGRDSASGNIVAIKVLKADVAEPDMIKRFIREGEALRQLNHPNIVKLLDASEENGKHTLVMELVEGGSLADVIAREGRLPVERLLPIALDLADALTRAHRLNIIHRDLKPANVLIAADGTPRLTDFGIAHTHDSQITETGALMGTIAYVSPELFAGESASALSDIWAFGVVLYEMLTGSRPFHADQFYTLINAIMNSPLPDLEALCPDAPIGLIDLIYRMLAKNPGERITSVRLVGAELEVLMRGGDSKPIVRRVDVSTTSQTVILHNLPQQTTPFVGRDVELQTVNRLLQEPQNRLVTIIGPGGMGKTRLSLEVAAEQLDYYANGAYFVELAPLTRADAIPLAIAEAMQYPFQNDGRTPEQQILDTLREKQVFLVLDNFEHIIEGRAFVQSILQHAPQVKVLVTSRERLNLTGETLFPLEGMAVPDGLSPEELRTYAAVKLFLQSARRIRLDYEPNDEDVVVIGEICRKVYGMPLGIVLAASWLEMLPVQEIADEITRSLDFLETTMQDVPERQRSLRGLFEYSWNLLGDDERAVFARLSMFHGGMTREAAQAVSGASLRHLQTLVNKSLIRRANDSGRYEVHELLRQFAQERLDDAESWRAKHADYFAAFVARREADVKGKRQMAAFQEIEADFDNIKAAWQWAVGADRPMVVGPMIETLYWFTQFRSRYQEGERLFSEARAVWPVDGRLLVRYPDAPGLETFKRGLDIAEQQQNSAEINFCLRLMGHWLSHSEFKHGEGLPLLQDSLRRYQAAKDDFYAAMVMDDIGWSYNLIADKEKQRAFVEESLTLRRRIGDVVGVCHSLRNMGGAVGGLNSVNGESIACWSEAVELAKTIGDRTSIAWNKFLIGTLRVFMGNLDDGLPLVDEAYRAATEINEVAVRGVCLLLRSVVASIAGDYAEGLRLSEEAFSDSSRGDIRTIVSTFTSALAYFGLGEYDRMRKRLKAAFRFGLQFSDPPAAVWSLPVMAVYLAQIGDFEKSAELVGGIRQLGLRLGIFQRWGVYRELQQRMEGDYREAVERGAQRELRGVIEDLLRLVSEGAEKPQL